MKTYWGSGCTAPRTPNLSTTCRWVFSFALRPFYSHKR